MNKVVIFQCENLVAVYVGGKLNFEGHEISTLDAIMLGVLANKMTNVTIYDEVDEDEENDIVFPRDLDDVDMSLFEVSTYESDILAFQK